MPGLRSGALRNHAGICSALSMGVGTGGGNNSLSKVKAESKRGSENPGQVLVKA